MCKGMCVCGGAHMYRSQMGALGPLELEFKKFVSSPVCVLGFELRSYDRAVSPLRENYLPSPNLPSPKYTLLFVS